MFGNADELFKFIRTKVSSSSTSVSRDLPGIMQHFTVPVRRSTPTVRGRPDVRRLVDPRLPGHPRVRHGAVPGPHDGVRRPVPAARPRDRLLRPRPDHRRGLLPRPAQHRPQGPGVPQTTGIGDTAFFAPEAEFYVFDGVRLEHERRTIVLRDRLGRGRLDTGDDDGDNRGYKVRYKGGYFPVPPTDNSPTCATT